jgi:hypothetical protein
MLNPPRAGIQVSVTNNKWTASATPRIGVSAVESWGDAANVDINWGGKMSFEGKFTRCSDKCCKCFSFNVSSDSVSEGKFYPVRTLGVVTVAKAIRLLPAAASRAAPGIEEVIGGIEQVTTKAIAGLAP